MSAAWIRRRNHPPSRKHPKGHATFQVLYRRGGREARIEALGSFDRDREARMRRDLVAGWLAQGLNPKVELARLEAGAAMTVRSFTDDALALIASRHDAAGETLRTKRKALKKISELRPDLVAKPSAAWTVADVQELVATMIRTGLAPATIDQYVTHGPKLVLEFAGVEPNPAKDKRIRLPRKAKTEVRPPSSAHVLAMLDRVPRHLVLPLVVLEQTAMRVGELVSLPWGDVDVVGNRFLLESENVKTRHPRWVQVPEWLMDLVAGTCPLEDRTATRRVFQTSDSTLRQAMARACREAGIPLYSPHDLRHRRASLWHGQGISLAELKARGGWSKAATALDVYSHVMPLDELARESLEEVLARGRG